MLNPSESIVHEFFTCLSKFQYDKAKNGIEKSKETNRVWQSFQNALLNLISGEKFYNNLLFLSNKSITRIGDRYFEPVVPFLEQTTRELSLSKSSQNSPPIDYYGQLTNSFEINNMNEMNNQLIGFINFRFEMMTLYFELKERGCRQERGFIEIAIKQLNDIEDKFSGQFNHPVLESLRTLFNIEIGILKNLLQCHQSIDYKLDCIQSIISIKEINDVFNNKLPLINSKMSKENKSFSLFSRSGTQSSRTMPVLYQWFKLYYQSLLNKFTLIMHDSFQMLNDINHILNDKIEVYTKLVTFVKKFGPFLTGIIFDANTVPFSSDNKGFGYEIANSFAGNKFSQGTVLYPLVFTYPRLNRDSIEKHVKQLIGFLANDLDQKVRYFYEQSLKSSYYVCKISDNYVFFVVFDLNKTENKAKTVSFVQEISDELNFNSVFNNFNQHLK